MLRKIGKVMEGDINSSCCSYRTRYTRWSSLELSLQDLKAPRTRSNPSSQVMVSDSR